jgi:hypothetical protein
VSDVKLLALWDGWCDPCGTERPLALTEHGDHGLRAWMRGVGIEDRSLVLACKVCGQWQSVPRFEEDDPEVVVARTEVPRILATALLPARRSIVVATAAPAPKAITLPAPRSAYPTVVQTSRTPDDALLCLLGEGLDVVGAGGR